MFVGRAYNSDQNLVLLTDGSVARARAMHRVVPKIRWDSARIQRVTGTPLALNLVNHELLEEHENPHLGPSAPSADGPDADDEPDAHVRRMQILLRDLKRDTVSR